MMELQIADSFLYEVFLTRGSKDKPVVRVLAERLLADGLRVRFDDREMHRTWVYAFGSGWAQLARSAKAPRRRRKTTTFRTGSAQQGTPALGCQCRSRRNLRLQ